jgi:hypothetical protein
MIKILEDTINSQTKLFINSENVAPLAKIFIRNNKHEVIRETLIQSLKQNSKKLSYEDLSLALYPLRSAMDSGKYLELEVDVK